MIKLGWELLPLDVFFICPFDVQLCNLCKHADGHSMTTEAWTSPHLNHRGLCAMEDWKLNGAICAIDWSVCLSVCMLLYLLVCNIWSGACWITNKRSPTDVVLVGHYEWSSVNGSRWKIVISYTPIFNLKYTLFAISPQNWKFQLKPTSCMFGCHTIVPTQENWITRSNKGQISNLSTKSLALTDVFKGVLDYMHFVCWFVLPQNLKGGLTDLHQTCATEDTRTQVAQILTKENRPGNNITTWNSRSDFYSLLQFLS